MTHTTKPIIESNNFIILDKYTKIEQKSDSHQTEYDLEKELIKDLSQQGYEYRKDINTQDTMLKNTREQLQKLNNVVFLDGEWERFNQEYLNKPSDNIIEKTRKIHNNYIYDFVFDNGRIQNIYLLDKKNLARNKVQVINQFSQKGTLANIYDVTILVNGLPLVQIELKKRGVSIREAFNQIHRYSKESFNTENSLFKYLQLFVISNGTNCRYFANTTKRDKNSFDFTMNWAKSDNKLIKDLKDFTATFLQKETLLNVLIKYSVFDINNTLLVMRPYQIAATERIIWKIKSSYNSKSWGTLASGGYIWHTTGSGKTLTSFKVAQLATKLDFITKVFFVVDRKDLDFQTMKEYQRFSPDSVNGSNSTAELKRNIDKTDNKIIVTTIQKLNNLMKNENNLSVYDSQVVFIFDEAHRSQFGEAQKNLKKKFKKFYQFGFTGTPIFAGKNSLGSEDTASVFGSQLHSYVITDAIRDEKVLKFKVDYNNVRSRFKNIEKEQNEEKLTALENKQELLHPKRIEKISNYILSNFNNKTHRLQAGAKGFNAMFAVSNIDAAKLYYESFKKLQKDNNKPLKIATIFSFVANEEQNAKGEVEDESFEVSAMDTSAKEFLSTAIDDYNAMFKTTYGVDNQSFQNYYRNLAKKVQSGEIDLLIVVGMFLTGFDAPKLNTLFVDKNLRHHGLIQAYSRTNRIYATKSFGNIVTFRDLEQATKDAIILFGDENTKNIILEKSYDEYMYGFTNTTGENKLGYLKIVAELQEKFPNPDKIEKEKDKKEFVKLFGKYLQIENILQNYDEFTGLKELQNLDMNDLNAINSLKSKYGLDDESINKMKAIDMPSQRAVQDYRSNYNDIREWASRQKNTDEKSNSTIDWNDIVFEVDLLKSQEFNLDYILKLIFEHNKIGKDKKILIEEARRLIRASLENSAKETLVIDFINQTNLSEIIDKASIIDDFYIFARTKQKAEAQKLIADENLNEEEAKRYITSSLKRKYASENGTELNAILPKMSPLNPKYLTTKQNIFQKISSFVKKFQGVGGDI
jgi:type I restriction enzyme R subunit